MAEPLPTFTSQLALAKKNNKRKFILITLGLFFVLIGISYGIYYNLVLAWREETDNAYVGGNLVTLTPQVNGVVVDILADETHLVKAGQALIRLDPTDAAIALKQAEAQLGEAVRAVRQQYVNADQFIALVAQRKVDMERAKNDYARRVPLLKERAIAREEVEHARQAVSNAEHALQMAKKQLEAARSNIADVSIQEHPSVLKARANFEQAYLTVQRSTIVAPVTGYVARRSVQIGQRIMTGMPLMAVVPLDSLWVDANFKESELKNIRIGQSALIKTDFYGSKVTYHGKVVGLAAGTGSAFSLLPAQNASGSWIKVVQRLPVRIELNSDEIKEHPLRVGLSATVVVDTHSREGARLSTARPTSSLYSTRVYEKPREEAGRMADQIITQHAGLNLPSAKENDAGKKD